MNQDWSAELATIGANVLDVYFGGLGPGEIVAEVDRQLVAEGVRAKPAFRHWIAGAEYHTLELGDGSRWVLLPGRDPERFIHLHPARNSPLTARFPANCWKTAVALYLEDPAANPLHDLVRVNRLRTELGLSPVKRVGRGALGAAIGLIYGDARPA